jgi:hypothetical protein
LSAFRISDGFATILQCPVKKTAVFPRQGVGFLTLFPCREWRFGLHKVLDVGATALHEVGGETAPLGFILRAGYVRW